MRKTEMEEGWWAGALAPVGTTSDRRTVSRPDSTLRTWHLTRQGSPPLFAWFVALSCPGSCHGPGLCVVRLPSRIEEKDQSTSMMLRRENDLHKIRALAQPHHQTPLVRCPAPAINLIASPSLSHWTLVWGRLIAPVHFQLVPEFPPSMPDRRGGARTA
jgi:hypothetical protein